MHSVEVTDTLLRFADHAPGQPYHAALVAQSPSSGASALHGHADYFEFMGVVEGHGLHLLPEAVQHVSRGDVLLVRPGDRHAFQGLAPAGMRFINVAFPAAAWRSFLRITSLGPAVLPGQHAAATRTSPVWESGGMPPLWRLDNDSAQRAHEVLQHALDRFQRVPTMLDMLRFWTDLVSLFQRPTGELSEPASGQPPGWLVRVCREMRHEARLAGGVPEMLRLAAVSPAHLSRTVREHYGTTPTDFVTGLRLRHAAELLGTTAEPVTRIAHRCGFSSQSYFTRCFRHSYGLPPREYRRRAWHAFVPGARQ